MPAPTARNLRVLVLVVSALATTALLAASLAGYFAYRFYLERARLKLVPTFEFRFANENARLPPPMDIRVVMFGDSRIMDWQPKPAITRFELVWRGIRGETTGQMVHRFAADTRGIAASVVVIQAGINDLVAGTSLREGRSAADLAFRNMQAMIESSTASGVDVILLTVIPPASPPPLRRIVWSDSIYGLVADFNLRLHTLAGSHVRILEADKILCGRSDRVPQRLARDTLHLLPLAYDMLNQELRKQLRNSVHAVQ